MSNERARLAASLVAVGVETLAEEGYSLSEIIRLVAASWERAEESEEGSNE